MASESSQSSSLSPSPSLLPSPSPSSVPSPSLGENVGGTYIGNFISLISKYEIRYEGVLYHLNVQDSTLGLRNVRSYGTEGRKKDGPQVPPCDRVYDYILFRGSDIKDLQVNPSPSAPSKQEVRSELDIDQSSHSRPAMSLPLSGYDNGDRSGRVAQWAQTPALSSRPVPSTQQSSVPLSFQPSSAMAGSSMGSLLNRIGSTQSKDGSSIPLPSFVQENKLPSSGVSLGMMHQADSSSTMKNESEIIDVFASPIMGLVDDTSQVVTRTLDITSNPSHASNPSPLGQAQRHAPPGLASSSSNLSPLSEAQLSALNSQNRYPVVSQAVGRDVYDSRSNHPNRSIPYGISAVNPLSNPPQSYLGMEPSLQPRQQMVNRGQGMFGVPNPVSVDVQYRRPATQNYAPLQPPPFSAHQSRIPSSSIEFTEEFDFEAMNEKFKKSEVWGFLGKNNQNGYREESVLEPNAEGNTKPAYNKEDFFDTISCNNLNHMGRGGQQQQHTQFPVIQNPEVFGNQFQMPLQPQPGQGAYLAAQSNYGGGYNNNNYSNSGYVYNYGGRGRGRNTHF